MGWLVRSHPTPNGYVFIILCIHDIKDVGTCQDNLNHSSHEMVWYMQLAWNILVCPIEVVYGCSRSKHGSPRSASCNRMLSPTSMRCGRHAMKCFVSAAIRKGLITTVGNINWYGQRVSTANWKYLRKQQSNKQYAWQIQASC